MARLRLVGRIDRADVPSTVRRALAALADCPPGIVDCDVDETASVALPTVDVLAHLALAARRTNHDLRLEHASAELLALLALCGLDGVGLGAGAGPTRRGGRAFRTAGRSARCRGRT